MQRTPITHDIKCWKEFYGDVAAGRKPFEIRKNDRDYQVGDFVIQHEYDKDSKQETGAWCTGIITYITSFEQKEGYVVFGLDNFNRQPPKH